MWIWILDDDVAASFETKERIKSYLNNKTELLHFEVFHNTQDLTQSWDEAFKNKKEKPGLCVLEFLIHQKIIFEEIPREFFEQGQFLFCSSASFGGYSQYCNEKNIKVEPFIEKSQRDQKLNKFLDEFLKTKNDFDAKLKRKLKRALGAIKELEDIYYNQKELTPDLIFGLVDIVAKEATRHACSELEKPALGFMELKKTPALKSSRFKKDLKELLAVLTRFKEKYQFQDF